MMAIACDCLSVVVFYLGTALMSVMVVVSFLLFLGSNDDGRR